MPSPPIAQVRRPAEDGRSSRSFSTKCPERCPRAATGEQSPVEMRRNSVEPVVPGNAAASAPSAADGANARAIFEILVREHADMLSAYLRTLLRDSSAIDDIFQEAMLVAWRRINEYDRMRPFAPWLRGIAHMLVLEHYRKARARPIVTDPEMLTAIDRRFDALERMPADSFLDRTTKLADCLGRLPASMREAVELVYVRNLTIVAAAESVDETRDALGKRVQRARQFLADCIGISPVRIRKETA
jgi:RNA polymerase sigma-70 factor